MKKVTIVWAFIVLSLFAALTTYGILFTKQNKAYKELEKDLAEAGKKYGEIDFVYDNVGETGINVSFDDLKKEGLIETLEVEEDKCEGYVKIYKSDFVFEYKGFVKCSKYTTKGYDK